VSFIAANSFRSKGKTVLYGVMLVVLATFFVHTVAAAFGINGTTLIILDFIPSVLGLALLLHTLDIF